MDDVKPEVPQRGGKRQPSGLGGDDREEAADLLSDPHCRQIVEYLRERGEPADIERLATQVAARVRGVPVEAIGPDVRRRVQTWLHHGQLPALSEAGVVDYDADTGTVRLVDSR